MRHLAVSTRFTNSLEDRYVPMKHKLRAIRDLRAWGKLHLAQFSTTWKLDWELTIDQPSTSTPCSTLNTGQAFRFALSRNRKKRIQSTSSQPLLLLLFQIHHRIGNLANLIYLEFRFRFASKIVGFKGKSLSLLTPILDHVNFTTNAETTSVYPEISRCCLESIQIS